MSGTWKWAALAAVAIPLAACGQGERQRTTGGAAAGAASGAGVGALAGPVGAVAGGVIGGGAGAITGATTNSNQVNLGTPVWDNPDARVPTPSGPVRP
ncbi:MAG TPA: hypothetical protein VHS58_05725 [Acetobacteraceae bacterium]|nr:hypothetical protein [Acetobacteraceae bacterium]